MSTQTAYHSTSARLLGLLATHANTAVRNWNVERLGALSVELVDFTRDVSHG